MSASISISISKRFLTQVKAAVITSLRKFLVGFRSPKFSSATHSHNFKHQHCKRNCVTEMVSILAIITSTDRSCQAAHFEIGKAEAEIKCPQLILCPFYMQNRK